MKVLFIVFVLFFHTTIQAQQQLVQGYLKDSITHLTISGGTVTNAATKKNVVADANGFFAITAAPNELMYAFAKGYKYDTLRYSMLFTDTLTLYLAPAENMLENVTVTAGYNRYQLDSINRRAAFEKVRGQQLPLFVKNRTSGFGLVLNLDRIFKKKYKGQGKAEQSFNNMEQAAYVNFRFSPQFVAIYTGLKGAELLKFIDVYKPSYIWLRQHPLREQVVSYLSDKLKDYRKKTNQQAANKAF